MKKVLPDALEAAQKLINDNPTLFVNDTLTRVTIAQALLEYGKECADCVLNITNDLTNKLNEIIEQ